MLTPILILGPTAGGKTDLSIALARALPETGECICADSMQVYREMNIGTAKPTAAEQAAAPHHLLDLIDPSEDGFSVDQWLACAEAAIADIQSRGRRPIIVGGTNLYIQAFLHGLFEGPPPDPALRATFEALDATERRRRLLAVDPVAAERIHPNDVRRTVRALEVHAQTGRPLSEWQQQWSGGPGRTDVVIVGLDWETAEINRRINARVRAMRDAGLEEEVRTLWEAGRLGVQARTALGYQQIIEFLENRSTVDDAFEAVKIGTRRLGKQQRTWLRRFRPHPRAKWLSPTDLGPDALTSSALAHVALMASPTASE